MGVNSRFGKRGVTLVSLLIMVLKLGAIGRSPQLFLMDGAQGVCLLSVLRNGDADTQQHKDCRRKCSIYSHELFCL